MASRADRGLVTERAGFRYEYCRAPQVVTGATFHLEHIVPSSRGGADAQANYALSCITCNGHKSDHISGIDPETGAEIDLYHPRRDQWQRHFRFVATSFEIRGTTPKGRATVARLRMNERKQIEARELWVELSIYP